MSPHPNAAGDLLPTNKKVDKYKIAWFAYVILQIQKYDHDIIYNSLYSTQHPNGSPLENWKKTPNKKNIFNFEDQFFPDDLVET